MHPEDLTSPQLSRWGDRLTRAVLGFEPPSRNVLALLTIVGATLAGALLPVSYIAAVVAVGSVLVLVLLLVAPWLAVAAVAPAAFITYRIGDVGSGLSVADMALFVGVMAAFLLLPIRGEHLDRQLFVAASYFAILLVPLLGNPTTRAVVEWGHRMILVGGGLIVGASLVSMGYARRALQFFVWVASAVAAIAVATSALTGFEPVYPLGFSKNLTGGLLAGVLVLLVAANDYLGLRPGVRSSLAMVLVLGLLAIQSRGAMLALVVGIAYLGFRHGLSNKGRWVFLVPVGLAVGLFALFTLRAEAVSDDGQFGSVETRIEFLREGLSFWAQEPFLGQGIRYYLDPAVQFPRPRTAEEPFGADPHPHNVVVETLSESGVVGLLGFFVLVGGTLLLASRRATTLSLAAGAVVLMSATHGLFDVYWLAGFQTVPWVVVGASVAYEDTVERDDLPEGHSDLSKSEAGPSRWVSHQE